VVPIDTTMSESMLIATALADADARGWLVARLPPETFLHPQHRVAWEALVLAEGRNLAAGDVAALATLVPGLDVRYLTDLLAHGRRLTRNAEHHVQAQIAAAICAAVVNGPVNTFIGALKDLQRSPEELRALAVAIVNGLEPACRPAKPIATSVPTGWYDEAPPVRRWLLRDTRTTPLEGEGEGVLPAGKVGLLVAAGGLGKTQALAQLAVCVASGKAWLGAWAAEKPGRVLLLLLAEEEADEARRRVYRACRVVGATPAEDAVHVAALAGVECAMLARGPTGDPVATPYYVRLLAHVRETGPWALVVVDPLSRFAGSEAERDNAWSTRFIVALESLAEASGAAVLCAHHSAQWARKPGAGGGDATWARGVTGLTDGARWVATMTTERPEADDEAESTEVVTIAVAKSNYSRRGEPIVCRRDPTHGGALVAMAADEVERLGAARTAATPQAKRQAERDAAEAERRGTEDEAVLAAVTERPGIPLRDLVSAVRVRIHCGADRASVAIARVCPRLHVEDGPRGAKLHYPPRPSSTTVTDPVPPIPPPRPRTDGRGPPSSVPGSTKDGRGQTRSDEDRRVIPLFPSPEIT
jgi:hypothetical protein